MASAPLSDRDHPLLQEAISLWNRAQFEQSLYTYERALAADPHNARIIINAARALFRRNRPAQAGVLLQRLVDAAPETARVHRMVGETLRLASLPARAIESFETARRLGDTSSACALELAALYEQAGRLEDARGLAESVPSTDANAGWAALVRAQLHRRTRDLDGARTILADLTAQADPRTELAAQAWAELATVLDAAGDFAGAWEAIERCKSAQRPHDGPAWKAAQHVAARFGAMAAELDTGRLAAWAQRTPDISHPPVALLAGFPRSGTTLLEQILDAHPGVRSVEERDVLAGEIFPALVHAHPAEAPILPILDAVSRKQIARARDRYAFALREWSDAAGHPAPGATLFLDKNPGATPLIPVLRLLVPNAPIIVALRDPRDVVLSCYMRYLRLNPLSVNFLTLERTAAKYALDMGAWLRFRGLYPGAWTEVKYEDLVADVEGTARRAIGTLGLAWDESVLTYRQRLDRKIVTSPTYDKVREPVTNRAVGRWRNYERELARALPFLEPFIKAFGYA